MSEEEAILSLEKKSEVILNPLNLSLTDRKITNKLYDHLQNIAYKEMYADILEVASKLHQYMCELEQQSDYCIEWENEINISAVFKALNVQLLNYADDLLEKLASYIKIMATLLEKKIIIADNLL